MAVNNTLKTYSNMEFPLAMKRQDAFALDFSSVQNSLDAAKAYAATDPTAYVGQVLSVIEAGAAATYVIKDTDGNLAPLGAEAIDITTDAEFNEMMTDVFGE